jgi:ribosomal protein S18 acetylase RimI-like enzyme
MLTEPTLKLREATTEEYPLIAEHFYKLWRDNDVPTNCIQCDWREITVEFIDRARQELHYQAFVAEVDGVVVASAGCQLFAGLYPHVLAEHHRKYGYIWGVYVEPPYRGKGIAKQLTRMAIAHLKAIGCTKAILHASPSGKPVYSSLGFAGSNEMQLDLSNQ